MFSTTLQLLCCASRSSMERLALSVFHHLGITFMFTNTQSWSVITLNLAVHVVMCGYLVSSYPFLLTLLKDYYYYATAGGARFWVCYVISIFRRSLT
jgi:hypothetical protein